MNQTLKIMTFFAATLQVPLNIIYVLFLEIKELMVVKEEEDLIDFKPSKYKVVKTGRRTGKTTGYIKDKSISFKK